MNKNEVNDLLLSKISECVPTFSEIECSYYAEAGAFCFEDQNHKQGVELKVNENFTAKFKVYWPDVTEEMHQYWTDPEYTTEHGACAVAFLLIPNLTDYTIKERSRKGTGFDYWLGKEEDETELPFQNKARLEVSGIRKGNAKLINTRVNKKLNQVKLSDSLLLPAFIVVVEFGTPLSYVVKK